MVSGTSFEVDVLRGHNQRSRLVEGTVEHSSASDWNASGMTGGHLCWKDVKPSLYTVVEIKTSSRPFSMSVCCAIFLCRLSMLFVCREFLSRFV